MSNREEDIDKEFYKLAGEERGFSAMSGQRCMRCY